MTKKKIALCTTAIIALMAGVVAPSLVKTEKVTAASENVETIFSDDFSTYNAYDDMGVSNWSNYYFDQADTIAQYGAGTERVGWAASQWASVAQDPENPANKVLDVHTETWGEGAGGNSYFYITPSKDGEPLLLKNYTISFRYKVKNTCVGANGVTAPWIATLNRKKNLDANGDYQPYDGAFIDATNAFMSLRAGTRSQDASGTAPYYFSEALLWDIDREPMPVGTTTNTVKTSSVYSDWVTYKCVVLENTFTLYLNDTLMTQFTVPMYDSQARNLDAGYVSIACCVLDAYLDDVTITTTPDHPKVSGQTEVTRQQGVVLPVVYDLETYGEAITGVDVRRKGETTVALDSSAYTYENGLFRLDANYVSLLPKGQTEFVIRTAKGSVNVAVNVTESNTLQSTPISLTAAKGSNASVALSGATAVYGVSRGTEAVLPATAWSFANGTLTLTKEYINYLSSGNSLPLFVYTDAGYYTIQLSIVDAKIISVNKNIEAAGSVTGGGSYANGATVTLLATTNTGYRFLGWYDGNTLLSANEQYQVTASADKTYTAKWIKQYTIVTEKNIESAGEVTDLGVFDEGETVTLIATTNAGYRFLGWYDGNTLLSANAKYQVTVSGNKTYTAKWEEVVTPPTVPTYTITVNRNIAAAGEVTDSGTFEEGATVALIATTNAGYRFLGWYDGNTLLSANAKYQVTVSGNKTYTAKWEEIATPPTVPTYTITVNRNIESAGEVTDSGTFDEGEKVTLIATTNAGYRFLGWYDGNTQLSANAKYQVTVSGNKTYTAKWEEVVTPPTVPTYTITVNRNIESAGGVTDSGTFEEGATVTLIATTNAGYRFLGWYDGNTQLSANAKHQVTVSGNKTYTAKWEAIVTPTVPTYTISVNKNIAAAGSVTGGGVYDEGATVTLVATTNAGYRFLGWYDGETLAYSGETFKPVVSGNKTYTAKWIKRYAIVTERNIVAAGEITDTGLYDEGATVILIATTNTGYRFLGWYDGNTQLSTSAKYQTIVSADKTYTAKWEAIVTPPTVTHYTIAVNGNIAAAGSVMGGGSYEEGATATLMAMTNAGYYFLGWYDGGTLLSTNAQYQVAVSGNKTYTAKWEKIETTSSCTSCSSTASNLPLLITAGALVCGIVARKKRKDEGQ